MTKLADVKLSESFLEQYRNKQPKWGFGGLGYIVYLRTYARKTFGGNVLERWDQTVQRISEGNFRIEAKRLAEIGKLTEAKVAELTTEMERFYHLVFNLVMTPPGRGLWMSGTEYAEKVGDAENNCWGVSMRPQPFNSGEEKRVSFAPVFTFDQAMKGGGVGINIQRKYVNQVPKVENALQLSFQCKTEHADYESELKALGVTPFIGMAGILNSTSLLRVKDSREGWAEALGKGIDAHYKVT
jgi:ribonucleoside-triphosphate reductase